MKRRTLYASAARRDLGEIQRFVARQSGHLALGRAVVGSLRQQCQKIARLPGLLGRGRPELGAGMRSFPFGNYIIFFMYQEKAMYVVSILERHRDAAPRMDGE